MSASDTRKLFFVGDLDTGAPLAGLTPSWLYYAEAATDADITPRPDITPTSKAGAYSVPAVATPGQHAYGMIDFGAGANPRYQPYDSRYEESIPALETTITASQDTILGALPDVGTINDTLDAAVAARDAALTVEANLGVATVNTGLPSLFSHLQGIGNNVASIKGATDARLDATVSSRAQPSDVAPLATVAQVTALASALAAVGLDAAAAKTAAEFVRVLKSGHSKFFKTGPNAGWTVFYNSSEVEVLRLHNLRNGVAVTKGEVDELVPG